jgi:GT2 family glycosyltransferase
MFDVSVIVVNWNTRQLLRDCIESILAHPDGYAVEIVVVDNHSTDGSVEMVREQYPAVHLIANAENTGFARANNQGVRAASGRYVLLLNSDAMLTAGALRSLMTLAESNARIGMVGARLVNADGSFQASFTRIPTLRQELLILSGIGRLLYGRYYPSHGPEEGAGPQPAGYVEGACMLAPRSAYLEVGGLDEGYFMYAEDVDLCYALQRAGWQVWYQPAAQVIHLGSASSKNRRPQREADLYRSRVRFFRKNYGNTSAGLLKAIIFFFTIIKMTAHRLLRLVSGGRLGRPVVGMRQLFSTLKGA